MILEKGEFEINNILIDKNTTKKEFNSQFINDIKSYISDEYNFKQPINIKSLDLWVEVIFNDEIIKRVEMKNSDPKLKNSYDNWSNYKVELKRKSHDEWLVRQLGEPHERDLPCIKYYYSWGEILSYYDPRSGDTGIVVNYQ